MYLLNQIEKNSVDTPNKVCISNEDASLTFQEFWDISQDFSNFLINNKKNRNIVVSILESNTFYDYVAMVGTLIAGGTYVPINSKTPLKKIIKIVKSSKSNYLFSIKKNKKFFKNMKNIFFYENIKKQNIFNKKKIIHNKIAYIIFTSGSTGDPKGVKISRKSLDHYIKWLIKKIRLNKNCKISQFPSISFDLSVADIYLSLCGGYNLVPVNNNFFNFFPADFIQSNKIEHLTCTPTLIDLIIRSNTLSKTKLKSLKSIFFCGEPLMKYHLEKIFKMNPNLKVINCYGPTEATVSVTYVNLNLSNYYKLVNDQNVTIGKSIKGMKLCFIKDGRLSKNEGELLIAGPQLSEGYIQNELNKKRFKLINKINYYLTGDIGFKKNNNYFVLGRNDSQVKYKGHRIELDEITNILRKKLTKNIFTTIYKKKLISFIEGQKKDKSKLLKYLSLYLESYKLPDDIIFLKNFMVNKNGKTDIKKTIIKYEKEF
tara:strand:+ start:742 stop:2196 length:1455 start_codon:yes stop_codon:yes gene_type:complete